MNSKNSSYKELDIEGQRSYIESMQKPTQILPEVIRPAGLPPLRNFRAELAEALLTEQFFEQRRAIRRAEDRISILIFVSENKP